MNLFPFSAERGNLVTNSLPTERAPVNSDVRRVTIFFTVGLLVAAAVGFGVWRMGTPSSVNADPTMATQSTTETTQRDAQDRDESEESDSENRRANSSSNNSSRSQDNTPDFSDDPFLAPNSVVNPHRETTSPTNVYRPEPIFGQQPDSYAQAPDQGTVATDTETPTQTSATQGQGQSQSPQPGTSNSQTPNNETSDNSPTRTRPNYSDRDDDDPTTGIPSPSQPSEEPSEPSEPGEPAEPSEPSEPAEPSEPSEPEDSEEPTPTDEAQAPNSSDQN